MPVPPSSLRRASRTTHYDTGVEQTYPNLVNSYDPSLAITIAGGLAISGTGTSGANTITGNGAANILTGNAGVDRLIGGAGSDTLSGGVGNDTPTGGLNNDFFLFNTALAGNRDTIIVYNKASGALFYDVNGSGAGGAIQFAYLANRPPLTASEFAMV